MQQINLYRFIQKPVQHVLTINIILRLLLLLISLLALISTAQIMAANYQDNKLAKLQRNLHESSQKIIEINIKNQQSSNKKMQVEIDDISKKLSAKKRIAEQLNMMVSMAPKLDYSAIFLGLANTITPDVWLSEINIANNGNSMELKGHSYNKQAFTQFVQNLKSAPVFANKIVSNVQLQNKKPASAQLDFSINMLTPGGVTLKP